MLGSRIACLIGLLAFVFIAWVFSVERRKFPLRVVVGGLALQLVLAFLILRTSWGRDAFDAAGAFFNRILEFVGKGSGFLFSEREGATLLETFAFGVLPTVIFFSSLMSILYHIG